MKTIYYLAYGSNLHPYRLKVRIPSSELLGSVELPGFELTFHMQGYCGSGKCNLQVSSTASSSARAAIYEIKESEKPVLDDIEGKGYEVRYMDVALNDEMLPCFVYLARPDFINVDLQPWDWYREIVFRGAQFHQFPAEYLNMINSVSSQADPDDERSDLNRQLIQNLSS